MSKIINRDSAVIARVVPQLHPETLHQIVRHRGLEASAEFLTSATPAQLNALLDLDLWRHARPGRDDMFDVERFGEWLEVMVDIGDSIAARTVAGLDEDVVVAGLSRYVRVLDPGIFEPIAQSDDEPADRHEAMREGDSSDDWLECELGGYLVRARRADAWDAIVALLVALDAEHGDYFHAVMEGCRRLSNSRPEIGGLDDLLLAPEQHLHDLTIERERRRSEQGYATPADARAFLEMARQSKRPRSGAPMARSIEVNPIVAAYFRAADVHAHGTNIPESPEAVELLTEAGVKPKRSRALLEAADAGPGAVRLAHLRRLMTYVRDADEAAYFARSRELAFLANTLLAGCSVQSRPFTPQEASEAAAGICNLGLECWSPDTRPSDALLMDYGLVTAFEVGWSVLHHDVNLFAADQLISILSSLTVVDRLDRDTERELVTLRRTLEQHRNAGTPWLARGAAEILAMLDVSAWISVVGLLDECPVVPAALTAVVEGRTTAFSPTEFAFISTTAQIDEVRNFMRKLPGLLSCTYVTMRP